VGVALLGLVTCRAPTQVDVVLSTDVPCPRVGAPLITAGPQTGGASSSVAPPAIACAADGSLGDIVIVPTGAKDAAFRVDVTLAIDGKDPALCAASPAGCIVARRLLHFLPHDPLTLPIPLRKACLGVVCPDDQTCVQGACVTANVESASFVPDNGAGAAAPVPEAGAVDASADAADAAPADAAPAVDAGVACGPPGGVFTTPTAPVLIAANSTEVFWSDATTIVHRAARDGTLGAPLQVNVIPTVLAANETTLFVGHAQGALAVSLGSGTVVPLLSGSAVGPSMVADDAGVAFLANPSANLPASQVYYYAVAGAKLSAPLVPGAKPPTGVTMTASDVWVTYTGGMASSSRSSFSTMLATSGNSPTLALTEPHTDGVNMFVRVDTPGTTPSSTIYGDLLVGKVPSTPFYTGALVSSYAVTAKGVILGRAADLSRVTIPLGPAPSLDNTHKGVRAVVADADCIFYIGERPASPTSAGALELVGLTNP
jgi:hypothetical protein